MSSADEIFVADMGEIEAMDRAKIVGDVLCQVYPGHLWAVSSARGCISVKELNLGKYGYYGFVLDPCETYHQLRWNAIRAGGELLERAGLRRGPKRDGDEPSRRLEGADPRHRKWYDHGDPIITH